MPDHKIELSTETAKLKLEITENAAPKNLSSSAVFQSEKLLKSLDSSKTSTKLTIIVLAISLPLTIYLFNVLFSN